MTNINNPHFQSSGTIRNARVGRDAGADPLGMSLFEIEPGQESLFHFHLQREELLLVIEGTVALRTPDGWRDLPPGEVVSFPRGPKGAHAFANRTDELARLVVISEQNAPNISVYPDAQELGIFDAAHPEEREFGARFRLGDAVAGYGGAPPTFPLFDTPD